MSTLTKVGLLLLGLALLPALVVLTYEYNARSTQEAMITEIYDQQLETLLFSVNQYATDVAGSWAGRLEEALASRPPGESIDTALDRVLARTPGLEGILLTDGLGRIDHRQFRDESPITVTDDDVEIAPATRQMLRNSREKGYRQLLPHNLPFAADDGRGAFVFALPAGDARFAGLVIDPVTFVQQVLAPKLQEVSRDQFLLGVFDDDTRTATFTTGAFSWDEARQTRALWLLPGYTLGLRLAEDTVEGFVQDRFYRRLGLVLALGALLLLVAVIIYRTVGRELELARLKADFVSNVSHELRTPLALIRMYAETLELGRVPSEARKQEYYRIIGHETERLSRLVNTILDFSKMEAGRKTYRLELTDVNAVVEDVRRLYVHHLERHHFEVELRLADALPPVQADREALEEALINLIDNAVKYSPDERHLTLATHADANGVHIDVIDRGIGIQEGDHDRIFDKFFRVASGPVHDTQGTGLGLALVRHIADAHGGRITVDSRLGAGSRFRLTLPAAPVPTPARTAIPASSPS